METDNKLEVIILRLQQLLQKIENVPDDQHNYPQIKLAGEAQNIALKLEEIADDIITLLPQTVKQPVTDNIHIQAQKIAQQENLTPQQQALAELTMMSQLTEPTLEQEFKTFREDLGKLPALLASGCDRDLRPRALCYLPLTQTLVYEAQAFLNSIK